MENHHQLIKSSLISTSSTTKTLTNYSNEAWYYLSHLLKIGHPVSPIELSSYSISFQSSPEFIEFLCSIPNSPLLLTSDHLITFSPVVFGAFQRFLINSNLITEFVNHPVHHPPLSLGDVLPKRVWANLERTYCRKKRMRCRSDVVELEHLPAVKKRGIEKEFCLVSGPSPSFQVSAMEIIPYKPDEEGSTSALVNFCDGSLSSEMNNNYNEGASEWKADTSATQEEFGSICKRGLQYSFQKYQTFCHLPDVLLGGVKASMPYREISFVTKNLVLRREDMMQNVYFLSPNSSLASSQVDDKHKIISSAAAQNSIDSYKPLHDSNIGTNNLMCIDVLPSLGEKTITCRIGELELMSPVEAEVCANKTQSIEVPEDERVSDGRGEHVIEFGKGEGGGLNRLVITPVEEFPCEDIFRSRTALTCKDSQSPFDRDERAVKLVTPFPLHTISLDQKHLTESYAKSIIFSSNATNPKPKTILKAMERKNTSGAHMEPQQHKIEKRSTSTKPKLKKNDGAKTNVIEKRENSVENKERPNSIKNQLEPKALPNFDSFTVEEEEGSGGYGTVYRAKRKMDGATFAVKCPHVNANRHHVQNEMKMLERFGGKSFVIKYEGSFKSGNSDCIVLEHFEHDRPEVLKKEISLLQLQWYGICLFRALASLHKQGVIHRDVKPGNFLFSRQMNKGYLIDFNLALDMRQKYGSTEKSKAYQDLSFDHIPLPQMESRLPTRSRKLSISKAYEAANQEAGSRSRSNLLPKNLRKKPNQIKEHADLSKKGLLRSQGADGSGVTSTKDATSTRVTSAERLSFREPIPCQGRKELISLAQEAMQSPNNDFMSTPASKRRRITAPPGKLDKNMVYLTPMPLHSTGIAVAGSGLLKNKGEGKHRKEGPCVGTKGFRAPEVLVKSVYQGPKIDVWSAGVTLLYLITGRAPFGGEPDQNIREIAKLRGSEDLWEVAKLHNRESAFPADLFDIQSLPSMKLREWCKQNTRRPDFQETIPRSLFDLVDKCLTVNPRLRISAEDAMRHEFFAPCLERLKKLKSLKQGCSSDSGTSQVLDTQSQTCEG